ncbi:MAG: hypothetical protein H6907_18855 [Hyphomicrobiales bacterium]|nr:hypothetical protein [Hyphomicrobiales bacterium]MCP5373795.1 hypothetical protein [Hyphomicrobiales bacterium]
MEHEDTIVRDQRVTRLEWLTANYPESEVGFMLHGGWLTHKLLEEAKYCFVYGQFLATAILGLAFIERILAARFYGTGRSELERAGPRDLLREAFKSGWISNDEFQQFNRVCSLRNPIAHFRRPLASDTLEYRAVQEDSHPVDLVQSDAQEILKGVFRILTKSAIK